VAEIQFVVPPWPIGAHPDAEEPPQMIVHRPVLDEQRASRYLALVDEARYALPWSRVDLAPTVLLTPDAFEQLFLWLREMRQFRDRRDDPEIVADVVGGSVIVCEMETPVQVVYRDAYRSYRHLTIQRYHRRKRVR
jgi:hypothetical protein